MFSPLTMKPEVEATTLPYRSMTQTSVMSAELKFSVKLAAASLKRASSLREASIVRTGCVRIYDFRTDSTVL